ncbi:NAD-dependent deacylase, partial [Rhodococcus hoagii]|nr:NAD-dependent deacylase [Prescottella equi]
GSATAASCGRRYQWRTGLVRRVQPNDGHRAVAEWARHTPVEIVTQNVDDLHERAGSEVAAHLHGSLFAPRCGDCGAPHRPTAASTPSQRPGGSAGMHALRRFRPPRGGLVRRGAAVDAWERAENAVDECDLMVVVGTSGVVYPAAGLPLRAIGSGATVVEINPQATDLSPHVQYSWRTTAARDSGTGRQELATRVQRER